MWQCGNCGESVAENFEVCWNCGGDRGGTPDPNFRPEDDDPTITDHGAEPDSSRESAIPERDVRWTPFRSCLIIALLLQAAYWSVQALTLGYPWDYSATILSYVGYGVVLALPGPIQRRSWRQMVGAAIIGGLAPFVAHWATGFVDSSQNLILFMAWPAAMMLLVASGEWLLRESDEWQTLAWVGACCLAAAALNTVANFFIRHSTLPSTWRSLAISPLLAAFAWVAIPIGIGLARQRRRIRTVGAAAILAIMAFYALTFEWGVFELARPSVRGNGPFSRTFGVLFLDNRGRDSVVRYPEARHRSHCQVFLGVLSGQR
ncbi:MAG: hypothetical protein WCB27_19515 [Thermoguttaceae bacterium]|jgi:hypothetical protein